MSEYTPNQNQLNTCGDCGCQEGQLHDWNCDMERCPFCHNQLLGCDCRYILLGLYDPDKFGEETGFIPPHIYHNGLSNHQILQWERILTKRGRIPYIRYPVRCGRCGKGDPEFFHVPTMEWEYYIEYGMRERVICPQCWNEIKTAIDTYQHPTVADYAKRRIMTIDDILPSFTDHWMDQVRRSTLIDEKIALASGNYEFDELASWGKWFRQFQPKWEGVK